MRKGSINPHLWKARVGNCLTCGKEYRATKDFKDRKQKYCSPKCFQYKWATEIQKTIDRPGAPGEKNASWKGDKVGYHGIHKWVARQLGKPQKCQHCKTTEDRKYEWASKNHQYKRDVNEWIRLCTPCHRAYDKTGAKEAS